MFFARSHCMVQVQVMHWHRIGYKSPAASVLIRFITLITYSYLNNPAQPGYPEILELVTVEDCAGRRCLDVTGLKRKLEIAVN